MSSRLPEVLRVNNFWGVASAISTALPPKLSTADTRHRDIARNTENIARVQKNIRICVWRKGLARQGNFSGKAG
ncbi:hypothetical protein N7489_004888 [Penicillium chrysogenum]|uniref:Uncharacterized protein n=1 Tax=Penicillium chrysogenum TaxID=5076 RepID=A0ABQ8WH14_PENCH|nr:uncharacterized protein N7489_004888 [Penicillium chrysogenum]KAJ5244792.1 hypothetical protein N7489_004888 [Penicillium chrysogenum]KAJ5264894.1 hypothetical protein N7505_007687 [Penicillium chrysogenum]KAJ5849339.1 hypothetical protein N7534_008028 [Penicillium rubens]